MTIPSAIVLYIVIWWTVLFAVLPLGVRIPEKPAEGHATSAPEHPQLWRKALITSAVAAVVWLIAFGIIESGWISFWQMAG